MEKKTTGIGCPEVEMHACLKVLLWKGVSRASKLKALESKGSFEELLLLDMAGWQQFSVRKVKGGGLPKDANIDESLKWLSHSGNNLLPISCSEYPKQLKKVDDAPLALFVRGNIEALYDPQIAIVGSRRLTPVGKKVAERISKDLVAVGLNVTSGLALGIDACAHQACCDAGGKTIAVLGNGLDSIYPRQNKTLANQVLQQGCIVSEFPIGTPPKKENFPMRNRIISGLSLAVVVVEAAKRSGSLITARLAMEQGKEVFAVPGSILSTQSQGCNDLIRQGAVLIRSIDDILFELQLPLEKVLHEHNVNVGKNQKECAILNAIAYEETPMEEIMKSLPMTIEAISTRLVELELDGFIVRGHNGSYTRVS